MISLIAATDKHGLIGVNNKMPWDLPSEMAHFRMTTSGHSVLMGRNTYESIGRPLPNRKNFVLTSRPLTETENLVVIRDLALFLQAWPKDEQLFIIGGAKVYKAALPYADELIISVVEGKYVGDTYFPPIPPEFKVVKTVPNPEFTINYYRK